MTNYWEPGTQYNYGDVVLYEGRRYKIVQPHRSQGDWTPPITPALWGQLQDQDPGYQNQSTYNPSYQQSHQQPQGYPQQSGYPEHKEESRFDEAKHWVGDHKTELGIGAAVAGVGAYALHKHNKEKEEQKHQKQQQSWVSDHKTELALGAAAVGAGAYAYHKHNEKEDEQKYQKQQQSQFDQAKTWAGEHEQQLKIGAGVLAGGAALAGGVAYYKHHEKEKEEEERRRQQQFGYQQSQYPQQQQKPQFTDQAKNWYGEHEKEVKIGAGVAAGAALLAGGAAYYKHQQNEKEEEERRQQQGWPQQQQQPPSREEDKPWYDEHKTELGLGAAALAIGGGAYAYHKHNEKEKEQEHHPQRPQSSDQEKSWLSEHEKQVKIGAGVAVGAAALAGGAAYYKHQQKEKEEQYGHSDYNAEITHLEEKTNRLHLDDERKHQLKVAGGVVAGTAALGGAYALYKHHEHGEDQKVFAANRELWLQDAQQRTDRFWQHGPNGPATWVLTRGPNIPQGALEVSREHTWNLYVCRSFHEGGLQVGKASESFPQGGVIGYGHQEIHVDTFEILLGNPAGLRWVPARGKLNPASLGYTPVEGGRENDGTRLYVAQAEFEGVFHPGKASDKLDGAYIPWGGTEKNIKEYRVLCYNN